MKYIKNPVIRLYPISYHTQKSNHTAIGPGGPLFGPDGPKIENPKNRFMAFTSVLTTI